MGARHISFWAVVAACSSITHHAFAATAPSPPAPSDSQAVLTLPPVEVRDTRPSSDSYLRVRPGFARAYDVSRSHGRLRMVSDLLSGAVGVRVRQFGGTGSWSAVSIRGCPSNQVSVYLDGVPLNSAQYGVVNAADLPIEALSRIEVYRGAAPLGFESPGGGAIHLVTRQEEGAWTRVSAGVGSFGTEKADLAAGFRNRSRAALLVAQYLQSDGAFRYFDDNATPFNPDDDEQTHRRNNRSESLGLTGRLEQQAGPVRLSLTHDRLGKRHGVPGTGGNPALTSSLRADRDVTNLLAVWHPHGSEASGAPAHFLRAYAIRQRDRFADPQGELTGLRQSSDDRTTKLGGHLQSEVRLPLALALAGSVEAREERYAPTLALPAPRELAKSWRRSVSAGAEARHSSWGGRIGLVGGVRRQVTEDDFAGGPAYPGALPTPATARTVWQTSWNAGARVGPPALAFKTSVARLQRLPTLEELFGNRGGIYGNPRARPEAVLTRDAGLVSLWAPGPASAARPAWIETQLSAYRSDATDLLVFVQNSQRSSVAQNVSAARLEGLELSLRAGWAAGLLGELSWTRQWTRDEGEAVYLWGKELPGRPRDEALLKLGIARARWNASYELHLVSPNCLDRYNATRTPSRNLHDVTLGMAPWEWSPEWIVECRNLTDDRVQDFAGFPLPGRTLYVGARARLERKDTLHAPQP